MSSHHTLHGNIHASSVRLKSMMQWPHTVKALVLSSSAHAVSGKYNENHFHGGHICLNVSNMSNLYLSCLVLTHKSVNHPVECQFLEVCCQLSKGIT